MGWLGWEPDTALRTDVNLVELAIDGRNELLRLIFGSGEPGEPAPKGGKLIAPRFKRLAETHNQRLVPKPRRKKP